MSFFETMELCHNEDFSKSREWKQTIVGFLNDNRWQVRYAAIVAMGDTGDISLIGLLSEAIRNEEKQPIYTQPADLKNAEVPAGSNALYSIEFPAETTDTEKESWKRRGKIKQAACLAIGSILERATDCAIADDALGLLHKLALDRTEDYHVRAAACKTLGAVGDKGSIPFLEKAATDSEWCTKTEAQKSIEAINTGGKRCSREQVDFKFDDGLNEKPFYIDDLNQLIAKLETACNNNTVMGKVWTSVKQRAQKARGSFAWFEPFVAMVTGDGEDIRSACDMVRNYVCTLEPLAYHPATHFHSWCYAFPHARWALCFQWLYSIGAFEREEALDIAEKFTAHQFFYNFSCMRVKPDPECVDNQTMSLCLSSALIGIMFGNPPFNSSVARRMFREGISRLPVLLDELPESGYSGEGSTYMDCVIAAAVPLTTELLERVYSGGYFSKAEKTVRMTAMEWMPDGLLLPWDHYGFAIPNSQCISYAAKKIDAQKYCNMLERYTDWSHSLSTGWGYDDLIWTLIWWPENREYSEKTTVFESWCKPDVGACLVSENSDLYLMQMWDESSRDNVARFHCNPNSLILSAYGSPLFVDGCPDKSCDRFCFSETERVVDYMSLTPDKVNDGYGCAGAHSVILVDNYEAMRSADDSKQAELISFDKENKEITADAAGIYKQSFKDAKTVIRRSRLCLDRFFIVEDYIVFENKHTFTSRFITRPDVQITDDGMLVTTPEQVTLQIVPLLDAGSCSAEYVSGYPNVLDGRSAIIDSKKSGTEARWLWIMLAKDCKKEICDVSDGWKVIRDDTQGMSYDEAALKLADSEFEADCTRPAFFLHDCPVSKRWWYYKKIKNPGNVRWWLQLPKNLRNARLWVNGAEISLKNYECSMNLISPLIEMPVYACDSLDITFYTEVGISHYKDEREGTGFFGRAAVYTEEKAELIKAVYENSIITVTDGDDTYEIEHALI